MCTIIEDGGTVNTPLFNAHPSFAGVFSGAGDIYDHRRHRTKTNLSPGVRMRDAMAGIKLHKVNDPFPKTVILQVNDVVSGTVNDQAYARRVVQLSGSGLKLIISNPDNGIFLRSDSDVIKLDTIIENKPSKLIAMLPAGLAAWSLCC